MNFIAFQIYHLENVNYFIENSKKVIFFFIYLKKKKMACILGPSMTCMNLWYDVLAVNLEHLNGHAWYEIHILTCMVFVEIKYPNWDTHGEWGEREKVEIDKIMYFLL